ncbi:nitrogen fixation protein NifW [Rhodobacter sp. Har01]|uniref:nitrogenase-stabilizing/protective protein NifW n=1 Tax=Rhodobacter sp. Har01 TaxID=2883999 RepID=UPI001D066188|nr:nitrogenase-stabilizing/protective protein NifW [Rhodobacter sp. Har01]MCB6178319.1 nitrogen fixation protein NifW [Rhodobacter sp. Har01]
MTDASRVLDELSGLSSAEEIFAFLGLAFDAQTLNVARLHIMKRFGAYLDTADLSGLDAEATRAALRDCLARAQEDFTGTAPRLVGVFKVFADQKAKRLVGLNSLRLAEDAK